VNYATFENLKQHLGFSDAANWKEKAVRRTAPMAGVLYSLPGLVEALGLRDDQVQQLIDFWHAVEYLGKLADSTKLDAAARQRWVTTQKKRLLRGEIGSVVDAITDLTKHRRSKDQTTWLNSSSPTALSIAGWTTAGHVTITCRLAAERSKARSAESSISALKATRFTGSAKTPKP